MAANVELEKQKSKAKFSIAVSTVYNVTFKTIEEKLKLIEKHFLIKISICIATPTNTNSYITNSVSTLGLCIIIT